MQREASTVDRSLKMVPTDQSLELPDGRQLGIRRWSGEGTPLVLLHGLLDCAEGWDSLARATQRPCVAFDLPGFGRSDLATRPRISAYASDMLAGLEQLGLGRYVLVGHSLGGAVATAVAERAPGAAAALVLLSPAGFGRIRLAEAVTVPGVRELTARLLPLALSSGLALNVAYAAVITHGRRIDPKTLARTKGRALAALPGARDATRAVVAAGASRRAFHKRRVAFPGPVWALWGEHDHLVPREHADGVRRAFPQAQVEVWPSMGHHPQRERPSELLELIERACASADDGRRSLARAG